MKTKNCSLGKAIVTYVTVVFLAFGPNVCAIVAQEPVPIGEATPQAQMPYLEGAQEANQALVDAQNDLIEDMEIRAPEPVLPEGPASSPRNEDANFDYAEAGTWDWNGEGVAVTTTPIVTTSGATVTAATDSSATAATEPGPHAYLPILPIDISFGTVSISVVYVPEPTATSAPGLYVYVVTPEGRYLYHYYPIFTIRCYTLSPSDPGPGGPRMPGEPGYTPY